MRGLRLVTYLSPGFPPSLFELLASKIGADLAFETETSGPPPGTDPFADGTYDLGWVCSTSFVDLALSSADPSVRLAGVAWVPDDPDVAGRPVYFGDLVVPAGSNVGGLSDLRGKRLGCNDPISLSGHHSFRIAARERGIAADEIDVVFTGGHHASLDAVVAGELDAAIVDSVVRIGRARHDKSVAALRVAERLGPWPVQPLVVRSDFPEDERRRIVETLLTSAHEPDVQAAMHEACISRLVEVGNDHYAPIRAALLGTPD